MTGLVSVIIPVFDVEEFLPRCVDSVLGQSYADLEVILVDDGSPDGSGVLCDSYARADDRVVVMHQDNRGLSHARNVGLSVARGVYVTFVDSDDWLHPQMVQTLVELTERQDADLAMCDYQQTDGTDDLPVEIEAEESVHTGLEALWMLVGPTPVYTRAVVSCAKVYRRALFDGVLFPIGRFHEDEFTTHRLFWRSRRLAQTTARLYAYRLREGSITASFSPRKRKDARDAFRERAAFFHAVGLEDLASVAYRKAFVAAVSDRVKLVERGFSEEVASLDRDLRALVREGRSVRQSWRFRSYTEVYAFAPAAVSRAVTLLRQMRVNSERP